MTNKFTIKLVENSEELDSILPIKFSLEQFIYGKDKTSVKYIKDRLNDYNANGEFLWVARQDNMTIGYAIDYKDKKDYRCSEMSIIPSKDYDSFDLSSKLYEKRQEFAKSKGLRFV